MIKVMTIAGTRPELIKLSRIIPKLDDFTRHIFVHTGQNYDYELNGIFFKEMEIRKPDYFLESGNKTLGNSIAQILTGTEKLLLKEKPDAFLILGDTNSCLSAIIAKRYKVPIYHMEAGNRSFDLNVPEEINRKIIDHSSDINLVYTEHARRNLLQEGIHPRTIYLTGSPMKEVLHHYQSGIKKSTIIDRLKLKKDNYFLVSFHREENIDNPENLQSILSLLPALVKEYGCPIIVSTHPRTKKRLESLKDRADNELIDFLPPFGFFDYISLQQNSLCVISDSGTISEESSLLKFPAITFRNAMERPEAMDTGTISLTGLNKATILNTLDYVIKNKDALLHTKVPDAYDVSNTSERVMKILLGTIHIIQRWQGIDLYTDNESNA